MLNNRERGGEFLAKHRLMDMNSQFRKSPKKTYSYRDIGMPPNVPSTPHNTAALDRVWTRSHHSKLVTDAEVISHAWKLSHHAPLQVKLNIQGNPRKVSEAAGCFGVPRFTRGTDASKLCRSLRELLLEKLPDPLDRSLSTEEVHQKSIASAVSALETILGRKKSDPRFRQKWLSEQSKDMFRRAEKAADEGAMDFP